MGNNLININQHYLTDDNEYNDVTRQKVSMDNMTSAYGTKIRNLNNRKIDITEKLIDKSKFNGKDIGFNSPSSDSYFMLRKNGDIEAYSSDDCRMSFLNGDTINLFAHNFNIQSKKINVKCDPMGIKINGYVLNPIIFTACDTGLDKNSWRDLTLSASARSWNDGLINPSYCRMDLNFKPFFPVKDDETEKAIELSNGWSLDD